MTGPGPDASPRATRGVPVERRVVRDPAAAWRPQLGPAEQARAMINQYGVGMALSTARRWVQAFASQDERCTYWIHVAKILMEAEKRRGIPHTKAQRRRIREKARAQRAARASDDS